MRQKSPLVLTRSMLGYTACGRRAEALDGEHARVKIENFGVQVFMCSERA